MASNIAEIYQGFISPNPSQLLKQPLLARLEAAGARLAALTAAPDHIAFTNTDNAPLITVN